MNKPFFLSFTFGILFVLLSQAQETSLFLDDLAFPCLNVKQGLPPKLLSSQAFLFELDEKTNLTQTITNLKSLSNRFEKKNNPTFLLAFSGEYDEKELSIKLEQLFGNNLYFNRNHRSWVSLDSLKKKNKNVIAVFEDQLCFTSSDKIKDSISYNERFSADPLNRLVIYQPESTNNLYDECLSVWKTTGKVPNLVILPPGKIENLRPVFDSLNKLRRFKAVFLHDNEYLSEIYWKERPGLITPAKLSYPITDFEEIFSPYKNGYTITPGEVIHHTHMLDIPRKFNAYKSSIDDQLSIHFSFDKKIVNLIEPDWNKIINHGAILKKDKERGSVLHFPKNNSFVDYSKENDLNFDTPISIAAWIKPDSLHQYMGIIGLGTSFSLKLNHGIPDFTTATIKDHLVNKPLEINHWHHLAVIFNPNTTVEFFINGERSSTLKASGILPSKQSFIIGNNIWGEQFYGSIDDLKIWDRGLSEKEIKTVFLGQYDPYGKKDAKTYVTIIVLIVLFFGVAMYSFHLRRRKKQKTTTLKAPFKNEMATPSNQVKLFGTFQVHAGHAGDITDRFSPLIRQMLAFFILSSQENPEGIHVKKINDTFWPGVPKEKAKENRGTNLKKLRKLLERIDGLTILYKNKKWHLLHHENAHIDFLFYTNLKLKLQNQLEENTAEPETISAFLRILKNGNILPNLEHEWLDPYKSSISDEVIGLLQEVLILPVIHIQIDLKIEVAKTIFQFDRLNEEALKSILIALSSQGNHGQAHQIYDEFGKKYTAIYEEEYPLSFTEIIKN